MKQRIRIHKAEANKGALDYSHLLDAPAGKHGFVQVRDGHLYFEDGARARFLGFNLPTRSNMPDHVTADKMAQRFASMGVNVIRLHAADAPIGEEPCSWSSCREAPLIDYEGKSSRRMHKKGLERLDYLIARLKEKGIYLHIDLYVARAFGEGDGLDYPGAPGSVKCFAMVNERMVKLQKEYARELLCHVNPYTGLALKDDPAVMTIQINNEDSVLKGTADCKDNENTRPYREELQRRFNHYLRMKYDTRKKLEEAWTFEGICALGEDEDPAEGSVRIVEGSFVQPVCGPAGSRNGEKSPARYADYMEYGIFMNRHYYQDMKDYLLSLGVRAPIATSNLLGGAADVYGHLDGDLMENNCYFNHPLLPTQGNSYLVAGPSEYVSVNPLTMQKGLGAAATSLVSMAAVACVRDKPFVISEWNEYGVYPFHSTAFVHTAAYACLNDWDGLILYAHHTSENWDDQPADEILNVFDAYNDPSVICQWGFMASIFLKGLVSSARHRADVVYTQNDLRLLPDFHGMPFTCLPYVVNMRNVFLDGGERYHGDADVAVNAGFLNTGGLEDAKHGIYYAWSSCRDAWRRYPEGTRLKIVADGAREVEPGVHLGKQALVFDDIAAVAGDGDYRHFASLLDRALKEWGVLSEDTGLVEGRFVSDTGEIIFDPDHSCFWIRTGGCAYFSGRPEEITRLSDKIWVQAENDRISLALLPKEGSLEEADEFMLTAVGATGMDETTYTPEEVMPGINFSRVEMKGKLYADTLEGVIHVKAKKASLQILNPVGDVIACMEGEKDEDGVRFSLDGSVPGVQMELRIEG